MAIYYVDSINGLDTNNGLSLSSAYKTLQALLNSKSSFAENTTINLQAGTYTCDDALVTKIPTGITVTVNGLGLNTTLKPTKTWGYIAGGWYPIGVVGATLTINKLLFDVSSMTGGSSNNCMNITFNLNNVAIINIPVTTYGMFSPYNGTTYMFRNCIMVGNPMGARTDAYLKIYNCYGNIGTVTNTNNLTSVNCVSTTTPSLNEKYRITASGVSETIGVYYGTFSWGTPILLKMNNLYYSIESEFYDSVNHVYNPLPSKDFTKAFYLADMFLDKTVGTDTFKPIDKFNNFKIITEDISGNFTVNGIKTFTEMIVANDDIPLSIANNTDKFILTSTASNNADIRLAFSVDKGATWNTINTSTGLVETLSLNIPKVNYASMTVEEKATWNNAKETISTSGIQPNTFNTFNFNSLNADNIRFAYVLRRDSFVEISETYGLDWQFDAKGSLRMMIPGTEYITDIYEHQIKLQTLITNPIIKVNILK